MPVPCQLVALLVLSVTGGESPPSRFQDAHIHMGTKFQIIVYANDEATANRAFAGAFQRIADLDRLLSDYQPDSVVSQLSAASPTQQVVDDDVFKVLARAQEVSRLTDGAFDVTVGPLTKLWRRARRQKQLPDPELLAAARHATGFALLKLSRETRGVSLTRADMRLDLGGIAKGYAADEALKTMQSLGVTRALVNAGGDIVAGDPPPGQPGWRVGVAPLDAQQPPSRILTIQNAAVATSGDAWQFVELNGKRFSHIIDPQSGLGLTDRSSVTVIAPDGTTADALASALSVMGVAQGLSLIDQLPDVEAIMVTVADGRAASHSSSFSHSDLMSESTAPASKLPSRPPR